MTKDELRQLHTLLMKAYTETNPNDHMAMLDNECITRTASIIRYRVVHHVGQTLPDRLNEYDEMSMEVTQAQETIKRRLLGQEVRVRDANADSPPSSDPGH